MLRKCVKVKMIEIIHHAKCTSGVTHHFEYLCMYVEANSNNAMAKAKKTKQFTKFGIRCVCVYCEPCYHQKSICITEKDMLLYMEFLI